MCGIVGYIGNKPAFPILLSSLKRLEYRGYDSFGFFVLDKDKDFLYKKPGKISEFESDLINDFSNKIIGNIGIAHTRWATTGQVTDINAHPHFDCQKNIFVVHNGIIENYKELKDKLLKEGHQFASDTDTEILAHLIEKYSLTGSQQVPLEEAVRKALRDVRGTYGIAVISKKDPGKIVAAKLSSPLVLGINGEEALLASDPTALVSHANRFINLDDNEIAVIKSNDFLIIKEKPYEVIECDRDEVKKGEYSHYMLKEIVEEPEVIENNIRGRLIIDEGLVKLGGLDNVRDRLKETNRLILVACGTARHAALVGEYMLEEYGGIPTKVDSGSEFRYRKPIVDKNTAAIFISQSGETADNLACLKEMKQKEILTLGITNIVGSAQARETDAGIYTRTGCEVAVASTKAFASQLSTLAMLTVYLGRQRGMSLVTGKRIVSELSKIPDLIREILKKEQEIKNLAEKYKDFNNLMYIGRKYNYPIAREGAHKIKEIAYIHAEGMRAGELKHCELALLDENFPAIAICPSDSVYDKMKNAIEEIKARKGRIIAVATEGNEEIKNLVDDVIYIPKTLEMLTPILSLIPLQLFAYYAGISRGYDVDKPRNLAKSVTVE